METSASSSDTASSKSGGSGSPKGQTLAGVPQDPQRGEPDASVRLKLGGFSGRSSR